MKAKLALEDGTIWTGKSFGIYGERAGEVVFNTSITGYQEILTDPSYKGQIVLMTYPLIGNYGINSQDIESREPFVEGFIIKECSRIVSNWRSQKSLAEYLKENNILGIEGIDTRALTRHIRLRGTMKAVISIGDLDDESLVEKAKVSPGLVGRDLVKEVTCDQAYNWGQETNCKSLTVNRYKIVVLDCGVKYNILRELANLGCDVKVVPTKTTAEEILEIKPDGILLSNGPGDPAGVTYAIETVKKLIGKLPIMGICFGHQILGLALGGKTYKLKFGHHGGNQPVKDLKSGKIAITVQNHCFCVDIKQMADRYYMVGNKDVEITHINLNDNTCEGMRHKKLPIFSVQFHPESSPGPHDARYLFREFVEMMEKNAQTH
ncbi:carbamoyl phosphate synthase small subunit [Methanosarcinales archaeon]|nr:MAG: carbamoyl phosphate synthase small subunit [Candidatus Omnitrophica bacterium 4484_213]RLG33247.1 MAG: carbamoyl phosphate synthase small subunit [Methanosarcinales archaeon]